MLHFASMRSHKNWSDILALWGLMSRHPWLKYSQPVLTCRVCRKPSQITTANKQTACCPSLDATEWQPQCRQVSAARRPMRDTSWQRSSVARLLSLLMHRLAVWSKEWSCRHLSRRWAWPCIMWITSTVCYRSWNVVKLKCNNLSLVNSNSQDFFLKTKTETFTSRPRLYFLSSRRLETKTVVSRNTSLHKYYLNDGQNLNTGMRVSGM